MSFFSDDTDPDVDLMLAEVVTRESYHLFEKTFAKLREDVFNRLCTASSDVESLLSVQAYAKVTHDLERRMKHHKSKLKKDKPIIVGLRS